MKHNRGFGTTQWGLVSAATTPDDPQCKRAFSILCDKYWFPIYAYIRRQGHQVNNAEDLTQEFFARILEQNTLGNVDRSKGRLRSYLLGAVTRFLASARRSKLARKRGGNLHILSLEFADAEERLQGARLESQTPERLFDRQWALTILDMATQALRASYVARGKIDRFNRLFPLLVGNEAAAYPALATSLNISPNSVKVALHRMRQEYRQIMRDIIFETLDGPEAVDDEVRHLFDALQR